MIMMIVCNMTKVKEWLKKSNSPFFGVMIKSIEKSHVMADVNNDDDDNDC